MPVDQATSREAGTSLDPPSLACAPATHLCRCNRPRKLRRKRGQAGAKRSTPAAARATIPSDFASTPVSAGFPQPVCCWWSVIGLTQTTRQRCLMRMRAPCRQGIRGRPVGGAVRGGQAGACPLRVPQKRCLMRARVPWLFTSRVKCAPCPDRDSEICATKSIKRVHNTGRPGCYATVAPRDLTVSGKFI
jgi:hypothetical protein